MSKERDIIERKLAVLRKQMIDIEADLDNPRSASRFQDYVIDQYLTLQQRVYELEEILGEADEDE